MNDLTYVSFAKLQPSLTYEPHHHEDHEEIYFIEISQGKDHRTRFVTVTQKGHNAVTKTILLWNQVQHKVNQEMGENSWRELMQNLGQLLKVTEQLATYNN